MAANRDTPTANVVPTSEAVSTNYSALMASHTGTDSAFYGIYRTTPPMQVMVAPTMFPPPMFPYINTSPIGGVPSLPTPPDVEEISPIGGVPSLPTPPYVEEIRMQSHPGLSQHTPHQQWAAAQRSANLSYFMSQTFGPPGEPRRVVPPAPMPALHQIYSSPQGNSSMSLSGEPTTRPMEPVPAIPALMKDGKQVIINFYLINFNF